VTVAERVKAAKGRALIRSGQGVSKVGKIARFARRVDGTRIPSFWVSEYHDREFNADAWDLGCYDVLDES
jgi:hypothetical protein